jgi:transposase-like protein
MSRPAAPLRIAGQDRKVLELLAESETTDENRRSVRCARALLLASDGKPNIRIAAEVGVAPATVRAWRERFVTEGLNVLGSVRPGRGRRKRISPETEAKIVHTTLHEDPPNGKRWTCRSLATAMGVSASTVQRLWAAHGLDRPSVR